MLYLQLHSSLSNMRSICQAYYATLSKNWFIPSVSCRPRCTWDVSSNIWASSSLKYYKILQSLPIYYLCFDETTLNNKNCRFPNRDDTWASWNWAGQGCSGLVKLSQIQTGEVSCRNPAAWLNGGKDFWNDLAWPRVYDVYAVSFRFRMSAECNVDFWNGDHMARSLTCLRYSQSGKMAKLHAQWSLLATGIHWM